MTILEKSADVLSLEGMNTQVYAESVEEKIPQNNEAQCIILEYKDKEKLPESVKCFTYSISDSRADVTALNVQNREQSVCFELLHKVFMSRIFIPRTSRYTPKQVLISSAVLLSFGVSAEKTVETINEILK